MNPSALMNDALASLPSLLPYASEQELAQLERNLALLSPAGFACLASRGRWKPARHLIHLNDQILQAIEEAQAGNLQGLVISMPPRHGKSELCSNYLPAWYLGTFPDRRVMLASYEADFAASWGR